VPDTPDRQQVLPDTLSGHYSTPSGRDMLVRYLDLTREQLSGGDRTDAEVAFMCGMASGFDIESTATLSIAKDRIRWLSARLARREAELTRARELMLTVSGSYELAVRRFWSVDVVPPKRPFCGECKTDYPNHKTDCLVTKLREAAKQEGK